MYGNHKRHKNGKSIMSLKGVKGVNDKKLAHSVIGNFGKNAGPSMKAYTSKNLHVLG